MRKRTSRLVVAVIGILAVAVLGLGPANASTVQFNWDLSAGFLQGSSSSGAILTGTGVAGGVEFFNPVGGLSGIIGWGCTLGNISVATCANNFDTTEGTTAVNPSTTAGRSALSVSSFNDANSPTPILLEDGPTSGVFGPDVIISSLVHFNRVIDRNSRSLTAVTIQGTLDLTHSSLDPVPGFPDVNNTKLGFLETFNNPSGCTETSNPLKSICDDRFKVLSTESETSIFFSFQGRNYELDFFFAAPCNNVVGTFGASGFIFLCNGVLFGIDNVNNEVFAQEGATSEILSGMHLRELQIPAPGALVLLGAGLLGAIGARRLLRGRMA